MFSFKDSDGRLNFKKIFRASLLLVILVCVLYCLVFIFFIPVGMEKRGQFGDMFGFIGALFSGLAFAGLIVTMLQQGENLKNQQKELELQREDLKAQTEALKLQKKEIAQTNKELDLQKKEMEEQNKTLMLQRFETTFFNLLNFLMEIRSQVRSTNGINTFVGNEAIDTLFQKLRATIIADNRIPVRIGNEIDHYARNITQILIWVDQNNYMTKSEKYKYVGLLIAHMSYHEMVLIFYYCLTDYGKKNAKPLAEEYALFRLFGKNTVFVPEHLNYFESGAYNVDEQE